MAQISDWLDWYLAHPCDHSHGLIAFGSGQWSRQRSLADFVGLVVVAIKDIENSTVKVSTAV
jgi:hypothetical protein